MDRGKRRLAATVAALVYRPLHAGQVAGLDGAGAAPALKVTVIENVRVGGKVKQEVILALGSFDATWLESFYEGMDASVRVKDWEHIFWCGVYYVNPIERRER